MSDRPGSGDRSDDELGRGSDGESDAEEPQSGKAQYTASEQQEIWQQIGDGSSLPQCPRCGVAMHRRAIGGAPSASATRGGVPGSSVRGVIGVRSLTPCAERGTQNMHPDSLSFADRLQSSLIQIGNYVPRFVVALLLLFVGYLVARWLERGTDRLLRRIRFHRLLERGGVMDVVGRSGSHMNPTRVVGHLVFWTVMFAFLIVAANAAGFDSLATVFSELVSYVPSVIAAIVIIIVGIVLGAFVGGLIMASAGAIRGGPTLARVGRGGVIVLAVFMALQELGVATEIVTTAFAILFGAVALAMALAFGLGNRELAGEVTRHWYEQYRAERDAIERESEAHERADEEADEAAARVPDDTADDAAEDAVERVVGVAGGTRGDGRGR